MILHEKGRAAATANSDHPAKENLHKQDSTTSTQRMQECFSRHNGIILRNIFRCNILFQDAEELQEAMEKCFGISKKDFLLSIAYLTRKGYIVQFVGGQSVLFGGIQIRATAQCVRLLAGIIEDSEVSV